MKLHLKEAYDNMLLCFRLSSQGPVEPGPGAGWGSAPYSKPGAAPQSPSLHCTGGLAAQKPHVEIWAGAAG